MVLGLSCAPSATRLPAPSPTSPSMPVVTLDVAEHGEAEDPPEPDSDAPPPSTVEAGRVLSLGHASKPFANYIHDVHRRLHPIFADAVLPQLATGSGQADGAMIELVIDGRDGALAVVRIVRPSGDGAFDDAAIDAVRRAAPFGEAPQAIRSFDGRVYLRWTMHPDPAIACSTRHASPFLIASPKSD